MSISTKYWFLALIYMGLLFIASSIPGDTLPETGIFWGDKFIHAVEYGLLSWIFGKALRTSGNKVFINQAAVFSVMLTILYGISDEIHQIFVPLRFPDVYDVVADGIGGILAQGIFLMKQKDKEDI
ncbi:MAG: VanZ family protein [bacterium]|nr:VanZ family protein [bacterium]